MNEGAKMIDRVEEPQPPGTPLDALPQNIGNPARRALADIGITTLEQLPSHRAQDLLALHGVGPRAIRILTELLAARGLAFRDADPA
ncbi:MAG: hypothetical protein QM753_17985 [Thermomicrobiales bacterium]